MKKKYFEQDPLWYKDAVIYELHVRAFYDSDGDGIGDFKGLTQKLDYLYNLGITAIWLLPFYPSPLKDDGYDIADYVNIHPDYGTLHDFKEFLDQAHTRGLRVITELVLNHTSVDHAWFQKARRAPKKSTMRNFYVWSDTPDKYKDARIIFKDFETSNWQWDSVAQSYYWHRFYAHQPDLNFDNPAVQKELFKVVDFWFGMGVDGVRIDAVPYLYERDNTNCENLPETHAFLKKLREHIDSKFTSKMLLAEANQWPEDAAAYFGAGDECHMAFHFPLMPRMFMALQMEDSFPIIDILKTTPPIPDTCQWAIFLRNHDELTLEMVTDEERDYMSNMYAKDPKAKINVGIRRRLVPLLGKNRRKVELLNILLFSLPGTPVIYYGDEIGMGDNYYLGDRDGVRTPMQWSPDRNAGFSEANPHKLYLPVIIDPEYNYEALNVENQEGNLSSILWWMKRIIAMCKQYKSFSRGAFTIIETDNAKILCFIRSYEDEIMLVAANLSRFTQVAHLNLSSYAGMIPVEVFSQNKLPPIRKKPYMLTFSPYTHFWFFLKKQKKTELSMDADKIPSVQLKDTWENVFKSQAKAVFEKDILERYIMHCRWFGSKSKSIRKITISENINIIFNKQVFYILFLDIDYRDGIPERYLLPVSYRTGDAAEKIKHDYPESIIASLIINGEQGIMYECLHDEQFGRYFLLSIAKRRTLKGKTGMLSFYPGRQFRSLSKGREASLVSKIIKAEQSNTSVIYDKVFIMKLFRRLVQGNSPELEIIKHLTEKMQYTHTPAFAGAIEYRRAKEQPYTIGLLQEFIENESDAWKYTIDVVTRYFERVMTKRTELPPPPGTYPSWRETNISSIPAFMQELIGNPFIEVAGLLGKRTAEMHSALAETNGDNGFETEPYSLLYQRSVYQSVRNLLYRTLDDIKKNIKMVPPEFQETAKKIVSSDEVLLQQVKKIIKKKISAVKTRIHGDYHLGQILYTGKDFYIIDFEGEPARTLTERKLPASPFKDIAGMIRSFHYAICGTMLLHPSVRQEDKTFLEAWIEPWYQYVTGIYLTSYLQAAGSAPFVPKDNEDLDMLLHIFLIEKAIYELRYEIHNRPSWIGIPIRAIKELLNDR
ncbi:MAG: maltose alpha-D-glucosyltransferase [bacterium]